MSCATCHNPEKGWTDGIKTSVGIDGQVGGRNAPTVLNTAYGRTMFWDGRAPSLEGQAQGPIQNKIEMGDQSYKEIIERLRTIPGYQEQFQKVFGTDVTLDGMAKAIATFERVAALSGNSAYDRYDAGRRHEGPDRQRRSGAWSSSASGSTPTTTFKTDVVLQKAKCTSCHVGFNFTDEQFHNLGIGWDDKQGQVRRPRPLGDRPDRRQEPRRDRRVQDADGPRHRPDGPVHARRQPEDARRGRRALRQGGQPQPRARQGHEAS